LVKGDANRLRQVIWNLLSNAIKFTPRGGLVKVRLMRDQSNVVITVRDTGQGIEPEFLPHVFDRFRQADSSSVRKHGGLGLGLAIVRQLVELHGGTIAAHSDGIGYGATFTIRLPIMPLRVQATTFDPSTQTGEWRLRLDANPLLKGLTILIVDDEEDARHMLAHLLIGYGAKVTAASSAAHALEILNQQPLDLMISDVGMPDMDGYSLIRRVRELKIGPGGKLPAIALTAYAQTQDRLRALAAGFQHHVPKPVEPAELAAVIASLTGRLGTQ
jgi:CheY-like chemotaxis protein